MPFEWVKELDQAPASTGAFSFEAGDPPLAELHLWPYRSLPRKGFVTFFAITFLLVSLPLIAVLGTMLLWGLLPFVATALGAMWLLLQRSYRDGEILEELRVWDDHATLTRHDPRGPIRHWEANPYWVRVEKIDSAAPVDHYLVLKGGPRDVEIGAFLSAEERLSLYPDLQRLFHR